MKREREERERERKGDEDKDSFQWFNYLKISVNNLRYSLTNFVFNEKETEIEIKRENKQEKKKRKQKKPLHIISRYKYICIQYIFLMIIFHTCIKNVTILPCAHHYRDTCILVSVCVKKGRILRFFSSLENRKEMKKLVAINFEQIFKFIDNIFIIK